MRALGLWTIGWVGLAALWLLYQGEWNAIQLYAAASAAALSLVVAFVVLRHVRPAVRLQRRRLLRAANVPWQVVREFGIVTWFLVRRPAGEGDFRRQPLLGGSVFVPIATGYSANSYVLDVDKEQGEALVHVLSRVPRGEELV